jgi:hypothetical protein
MALPQSLPFLSGLVLIFVGLGIAFLGRQVIKLLIFLGAGVAGGSFTFSFLQGRIGDPFPLVGAIIAFLVLGFLSIAILKVIFGVMTGIVGYYLAVALTGNQLMAVVAGIIVFVIGLFLFKYYLSLGTAFGGAVLVMTGLQSVGVGEVLSLFAAILVGIAGAYVQFKQLRE